MGKPILPRFCGLPEERFWAKVDVRGANDCWLWMAGVTRPGPHGYGRFMAGDGRLVVAHRFAWEEWHGPVPTGMVLCHRCDRPRCCNPEHMFVGTQTDNMRDCAAKGRIYAQTHEIPAGDDHPNTLVPDSVVVCMRMDYAFGNGTMREIADSHDVNPRAAEGLISGRSRRHLPSWRSFLEAP